MLDVLLVKIQPIDQYLTEEKHGFKFFPVGEDPSNFEVSVLNGNPIQFRASKVTYSGSESYNEKVDEINKNLDVDSGGDVVAIDKYPFSRFIDGAKIERSFSEIHRYEVECCSENINYDVLILLPPSKEPIILSTLDFAYSGDFMKGLSPDFIGFYQKCVLSVTTPFGEVKGIALRKFNEHALTPEHSSLFYTMSFEKVSLPPVILQKLLESKPQSEI